MTTLEMVYRRDVWLRLGAPEEERGAVVDAWLDGAPGWVAAELPGILARAAAAPTYVDSAERFLLVSEDRNWYVLEVSLLSGETGSLDPETDFEGERPEPVQISAGLSGYRLITMEPAGRVEGLDGDDSQLLLPQLHYFLRFTSGDRGWVYAGMLVANPLALPTVVSLVEELLAGLVVA